MSWVRCPSAAPIIKNSRQRGACPQKHRRVGSGRLSIDSWTEQHSQILFSRIISRKHRRASPEPVSVRRCTQHRKYRVGRDTSSPTGTSGHTCRAPKFLRAAWTIRAYYRTATGQSSAITLPNPSQAEERTKTEARAMQAKGFSTNPGNAMSSVTPSRRASEFRVMSSRVGI